MSLAFRPAACRRTPAASVSTRPAACSTNQPTRSVVVTRRTCLKGRDLAFCTCLLRASLCLNSYFSVQRLSAGYKSYCFIGMCPESCRSNGFVRRRELFTKMENRGLTSSNYDRNSLTAPTLRQTPASFSVIPRAETCLPNTACTLHSAHPAQPGFTV